MKTKLYPILIVLSAVILGLTACTDDNQPSSDTPYAPEGKMFLPVLTHKPDMDKIEQIEKIRTGRLEKKLPADPANGQDHILYEFSYKGMKVKSIQYLIHPTKGILLEARAVVRKEGSTLEDFVKLLKKQGFEDKHILAKRFSGLAGEKEDGLFALIRPEDEEDTFIFRQFGKQSGDQVTLSSLNTEWDGVIENPFFTYPKIKEMEDRKGSTLIKTELVEHGEYKGYISIAIFGMAESERPMLYRVYLFDVVKDISGGLIGTCKEVSFYYDSPALAFYTDDIQGISIPTREFLDLYKKAGYDAIRYNKHYAFKNTEKGLVHGVKSVIFEGFKDESLLAIKLHKERMLQE